MPSQFPTSVLKNEESLAIPITMVYFELYPHEHSSFDNCEILNNLTNKCQNDIWHLLRRGFPNLFFYYF